MVKTVAVVCSGALVDRKGRRCLLLISSSGIWAAMALLSISLWQNVSAVVELIALCIFVISFSLGFGPIVYVFNAEIYPLHRRSVGLALAMGMCRVLSAVVSSSFLTLIHVLSAAGALALYSSVALVGVIFIFFVV